ncbi:uncharacterized protein LOC110684855 [Chenopodium quinoa]|uniref:uncharacterized protein LOC110684855 n=1 Tax=Chenopodium quinoa TaxID=63459 RepID=UPI000B78FA91|nr:uncharacterized protein LOC110684855 [Chenopodium quinoa]XP_021716992.1 uncharacterized protein LOC110684855 [Chenopodium quinoa]
MAGNNPKSSSTTTTNRPPPSSERKSRWQSSSSATPTTTTTTSAANPTSGTPSKPSPSNAKPPSDTNNAATRSSSDKPTPKRSSPFPSSVGPPPPLPPPTYGFHMLDRRTIVLADGSVRSYFALPPDYQDFTPPPRPPIGRFGPPHELGRVGPMSPDGFRGREDHPFGSNSMSMKRKFGFGEERDRDRDGDEFARQKQQLLQYGNAGAGANLGSGTSSPFRRDDEFRNSKIMRAGAGFDSGGGSNNVGSRQEVQIDPPIMKAYLHFIKLIYENPNQKKNYLENGKHLQCLVCGRSSKEFPDMHALVMHTYNSDNADLRVDHLGLHKALCAIMGWSFMRPPDSSRAYQHMPAEEAAAYQDDLIMWPPMVIINNTNTGKGKDGRMEGLGNKAMDSKLRDLGFSGGKSKSLYSRDGHLGITLIKFASDQSGLKEAMRLADHFEKDHHGRRDWARVQSITTDKNEESNPNLVMVDQRTGERRRILYGYLALASDLDKVDFETRKKVVIESKFEKLQPSM